MPTNVSMVNSVKPTLAMILDEGTTSYHGEAVKGSLTSEAKWKIKRLVIVGSVTTVTWADGDSNFDNVWDNRATLNYS